MTNYGFFLSLESQLLNIYLHATGYAWRFLEVRLKIAFEEQTVETVGKLP